MSSLKHKVIINLLIFSLGFVIGFLIFYQQLTTKDPLKAVMSFTSNWGNEQQMQFSSNNIAPSGNGYFVAGMRSDKEYHLFYTWNEKGQWKVFSLSPISPYRQITGTPFDNKTKVQVNWSYTAVWAKENNETRAVVGYTRLVGGVSKSVPFSYEQIGDLPIWVHKYQRAVFITTFAEGFNISGTKIWSTQ